MNDTALRGLLSVSFLDVATVGIRGEDLHVFAVEAGEGDESVLAAERRHRWPNQEADDDHADSGEQARDTDHGPTLNEELSATQA